MAKTTIVMSRDAAGDEEKRAFEDALTKLFAGDGQPVLLVPHIHHVPEDDPVWEDLAGLEGPAVFLSWMYPRPAEWILRRHGIGGAAPVLAVDMNAHGAPTECYSFVTQAASLPPSGGRPAVVRDLGREVGERWYPVVDCSRCISCKQCMEFCLFGVYELDDAGKVVVSRPDNCKAGCPACSRICPRGAIMFPLHETDCVIAGAPGTFMSRDPAMKATYYKRTGKPCPICGRTYGAPAPSSAEIPGGVKVCRECGLPLADSSSPARDSEDGAEPRDELDSLIDDLERLR